MKKKTYIYRASQKDKSFFLLTSIGDGCLRNWLVSFGLWLGVDSASFSWNRSLTWTVGYGTETRTRESITIRWSSNHIRCGLSLPWLQDILLVINLSIPKTRQREISSKRFSKHLNIQFGFSILFNRKILTTMGTTWTIIHAKRHETSLWY